MKKRLLVVSLAAAMLASMAAAGIPAPQAVRLMEAPPAAGNPRRKLPAQPLRSSFSSKSGRSWTP
ncbi:MAG: hypothetical protein ACLR94_03235 [Acutalibacteraceae bacterium]